MNKIPFFNRNDEMSNVKGSAVIVGASLSGLMTGIALAREGLLVTIFRGGAFFYNHLILFFCR